MRVLSESWCFCNGGGKSEKLKASIFCNKSSSMVKLSSSSSSSSSSTSGAFSGEVYGTGIIIHKNLLLTTHSNIASVNAAECTVIQLHNGVSATLLPHRFFITSSVLDLTIVGLDTIEGDYSKPCSKPNLELGNGIYLLGHVDKNDLTIGEGKVVIATDNLIKLSTDSFVWSSGSAGFDSHGNLAFMICDPMKIATSPNARSSSASLSSSVSWKKDFPMQFGIPMPVIFDWLNQHWEGSLDDVSKAKLPLTRLLSTGHRSEHSCASFSMKRVFKATEEIEVATSSSNSVSKPRDVQTSDEEKVKSHPHSTLHMLGIPTPEIYESPKVTANLVNTGPTQIRLLDISFPPTKVCKPSKRPLPVTGENYVNETPSQKGLPKEEKPKNQLETKDSSSAGSVGDAHSEVQLSCSPTGVSRARDEMSSEGETLYSAETAESRNYSSPREGGFQPVGRSQSCVSYNRWGPVHRNPVARRSSLENQRSFTQPRKTYSQGAPSHKTMDYFSPTVSSIMKKRNEMERLAMKPQPLVKPRPTAAVGHYSPRWNF
ncbi:hypothetical protein RND81_05G224100 [Saponaria officinalis]|uniref:Uncharacterized protein n=1 Tax=Saponaria officinalis TaxID=3572 RepID=A0AAW1L1D1_SAPOF